MKRLIHSKLSGVIASFQLTANTAVMDMCLFIFIFHLFAIDLRKPQIGFVIVISLCYSIVQFYVHILAVLMVIFPLFISTRSVLFKNLS